MTKEADLYLPIKNYFLSQGYEVYGEVKDIDMVLKKDEDIFGIELKTTFNLKLILQAVERQKYMNAVYVAIEKPTYNKRYKEIVHLLKRLEIGLITVDFLKTKVSVTIEHHPILFSRKTYTKKKQMILKEVNNRLGIEDNIGGTTKVKRLTSYKEDALLIAYVMTTYNLNKPKDIKSICGLEKTGQILYNNYYKWFIRTDKGMYDVTLDGHTALKTYEKTVCHFDQLIKEAVIHKNTNLK